jgi:predicted nucleotidyltransferase
MAEEAGQAGAVAVALSNIVGDALIAVYLHGSAAAGGLRPQSDIDLLAALARPLTAEQRDGLLSALLRLSARHPAVPGGPRCIELIAFCERDLAGGAFPMRAEFIYGEWLRDAFEAGTRPAPTHDPDDTLILAQARLRAIPLLGPPAPALLPAIPKDRIREAMGLALPGLVEGLRGDERNVLLTLARMWHTAATGEFVAKDTAAAWAMPRIGGEDAATLDLARRAYRGEVADDWSGRAEAARALAAHLAARVTADL